MNLETTNDFPDSFIVGDYILKSKLGGSSLSSVWKAEHRVTGEEVAVKQVYLSKLNKHLKNCLDCELNFLSSVNHPNIISLFDVFQVESCIFLVLEFCKGGNLASYIRLHGRVQEEITRRFMQQLGAGLEILQSHHIIHRDLKPENILLSGQEADVILKIADFGLSRSVQPGKHVETVCGSSLYMAPEVLQFQGYDDKVVPYPLSRNHSTAPSSFSIQNILGLSCCRTSSHVHAFHSLNSSFKSYIQTVLICVQGYFL
ncbi:serine/threonine-protein kinase ATG1t isoform X6 [Hevea brasiliensis]|uniref:serine/threonine-protein kinase ATG1t isoform X6 n=1 Tax=Hevea brasiliensis TaxID=3981 RepID=UPI0025FDFDD0|nr:serine/threonine-protein kinase ATG1t isoform X6 [Hevea brasiliensis]XP_021686652.2 serine/threonine-protein kinase ATG1t isoform X6 [Hevea brasiliensis]